MGIETLNVESGTRDMNIVSRGYAELSSQNLWESLVIFSTVGDGQVFIMISSFNVFSVISKEFHL